MYLQKNDRRWGCRCGNATSTPGKLTCFGQRCPCYTEQKPCDRCKCRGCRNPRQKRSNDDNNLEIDKIRRKPVTLELVSSLKPSHIKNKSVILKYFLKNYFSKVISENVFDFRDLSQCTSYYTSLLIVDIMIKVEQK